MVRIYKKETQPDHQSIHRHPGPGVGQQVVDGELLRSDEFLENFPNDLASTPVVQVDLF